MLGDISILTNINLKFTFGSGVFSKTNQYKAIITREKQHIATNRNTTWIQSLVQRPFSTIRKYNNNKSKEGGLKQTNAIGQRTYSTIGQYGSIKGHFQN